MPRRTLLTVVAVAAAMALTGASPARGADTAWVGSVDAAWSTPGNWTAGVPTATDNAFLPNPLALNPAIVLPGAAEANRLTVSGSGYSLTSGSLALLDNFYVDGAAAALVLDAGARLTSPTASIGVGAGSAGNRLTVASTLEVAGTLNVGYDGTGSRLTVAAGGFVSAANVWVGGVATSGSNLVQVFPASDLSAPDTFVVGYAGDANAVNVLGTVTARATTLGLESGADGNRVTVLSSGFWLNTGALTVGASSSGNAFVVSGGPVQVTGATSDVIVGDGVGASGNRIDVIGGSFSSEAALVIGRDGSGNVFNVSDEAVVTSENVRFGLNAGSVGNVGYVDGPGTSWSINGKLRVGSAGADNSLFVTGGGLLAVASDIFVGGTATGSDVSGNSIVVNGGKLSILASDADLVISYGTGTNSVTVRGGGELDVPSIRMGPNGTLAIGEGDLPGTVLPTATIDGLSGGHVVFNHTADDYQFPNVLSGGLRVTQFPAGRTVLSGSTSYTGVTTVQAGGTLALSAALNNIAASTELSVFGVLDVSAVTGGFTLADVQTLAGAGSVVGPFTTAAGATVAPLGSGTLSFGSALTQAGAFEIFMSGSTIGGIDVTDGLTLGPASSLTLTVGDPLTAFVYVFAEYGSLVGTFGTVTGVPDGFTLDYNYLGGNRMALVAPVPEPATGALALAGCVVAAVFAGGRRARVRRDAA